MFWPLVLGGVIAGGIGYAAAELDLLDQRQDVDTAVPQGFDSSEFDEVIAIQDGRITALESVEPATPTDLSSFEALPAQIGALDEGLSTFSTRLSDLEARLTAIEKRPDVGESIEEVAATYEKELAALRETVSEQGQQIDDLSANAQSIEEATEEVARTSAIRAELTNITAAVNDGDPYTEALVALQDIGVTEVPAALQENAETGVVTLNSLQVRFPETARATLSTARAETGTDGDTGFGGFLRRQLGARSVTPREGDGADAILSRAEAAVREGRLGDALAELDTLPETTREGMGDWLADARSRHAAKVAIEEMSDRLTANEGN